jgi:predicted RND superfamily exporter protein
MTDPIGRALGALTRLAARRSRALFLAAALITAGAVLLLPRFRVELDIQALFPPGHEAIDLVRALSDLEASSRTLTIVFRGREAVARLPDVVARLRASPHLEEVIATRAEFGGARLERASRAPLWSVPAEARERLERRLVGPERRPALEETQRLLAEDPLAGRELALRDPLGLRWPLEEAAAGALPMALEPGTPFLVLRGGETAVVRARGRHAPYRLDAALALHDDVEERLAGVPADLVGGYAIARADSRLIRGDIAGTTLSSTVLLALYLSLSMRSLLRPLLLTLVVVLTVVWTLAYGGALLGPLSPVAVAAAGTLMGLGDDFGIHFLARSDEERRTRGHVDALVAAARRTARPILGAMLTTVAAFLSLALSSFAGLRSFGVLLAGGLVVAFVATFAVLPLLLPARPARKRPPGLGPVVGACRWIVGSRLRVPAAAAVLLLGAAGWAAVGLRGVAFDANPRRLRPADDPQLQAQARLETELGFSPLPVHVLLDPPRGADELARAAARLEAGPMRLSDGPHRGAADEAARASVAAFRERTRGWVAATVEEMRALGFRPEAFREGLEEWDRRFAEDPPPEGEEFVVRSGGRRWQRITFHPRSTPWTAADRASLGAAVREAFGPDARMVTAFQVADELAVQLEQELRTCLAVSCVAVALLVFATLRRPGAALLALAPVAAASGITLGALAVSGHPLHLGNFVALPFLLGLGVDFGLHFMARRQEGTADVLAAAGPAVWRSTATTLIGFGTLVQAKSPGIASLGVLLAVGISASFLASTLLLAGPRAGAAPSSPESERL